MNEQEWNDRLVAPLQEAIDAGVFDEGTAVTLGYLVNLGNNSNEADLEGVAKSIKELCKGKPGSPFGRRGKPPALPSGPLAVLDQISADITEAFANAFDSNSNFRAVILRHGRSKGVRNHADGTAYAATIVKSAGTVLKDSYKDGSWDGTEAGLMSLISDEEEWFFN